VGDLRTAKPGPLGKTPSFTQGPARRGIDLDLPKIRCQQLVLILTEHEKNKSSFLSQAMSKKVIVFRIKNVRDLLSA
jgi:hypothetical protein